VGRQSLPCSLSDEALPPAALVLRLMMADTARGLVRTGEWRGAGKLAPSPMRAGPPNRRCAGERAGRFLSLQWTGRPACPVARPGR